MAAIDDGGRLIWAVCSTSKAGKGWIRAYDDEQTARDDVLQLMENPPRGHSYAVECVRLYEQVSRVTSLRDYFAAQALNGMLANGFMPDEVFKHGWKSYVDASYRMADAMLRARKVPA